MPSKTKQAPDNRTRSADYHGNYSPVVGRQAQRWEIDTSQRAQRSQRVVGGVQEIYCYIDLLWTLECAGAEFTLGIGE